VFGDYLLRSLVLLGATALIGLSLTPAMAPTWYPRTLQVWGRTRGVRVEFVLGPGLRLREGHDVEVALGRLYVRLLSVVCVALALFASSYLLVLHGPRLSTSTTNSVAVAGLPLMATLIAVVRLNGFTQSYRTADGHPRGVGVEDYVWPAVRAVTWVSAGAGVLVPVAFALLAAGSTYDADKLFWEGLTSGPLAGAVLVLTLEHWLGRITDVADDTDPTLYVWDCMRAWAVKILLMIALADLALGFNRAIGGLNGVALVGLDPPWLARASVACWLLQGLATLGMVMVAVQPAARLRARLWPRLSPGQPIEFGTAIPIP